MSGLEERELSSAPPMPLLFARAGASMLPGASLLGFVGGRGGDVPELALTLTDVAINRDRLASYDRVCGFDVGDRLPSTYPHMLAFPLHLRLMTDSRFPFPAIGLVHISNTIAVHRPIDARELLTLRVWATTPQPHPRGTQFSIQTQARAGDELVWEETSINLRRGPGHESAAAPSAPPSGEAMPPSATWRLPGDLGRRYGSVSGDLNPIHIHSLSARLFGFRSAIAHGMWTMARCLAALGPQLPAAFTVEVAFRRPILLPANVQFAESSKEGEIHFAVLDSTRTPHLDGAVKAL